MKQLHSKRKSILAAVWIIAVSVAFAGVTAKRLGSAKAQTSDANSIKPELVVQSGHEGIVEFLMFSPDGKLIVSGDNTPGKT